MATAAGVVPDFPGLGGLNVGDGSLWVVNVEAQEVKVIHCFQFHWIAEKVVVYEGLDGWVGEETLVVHDETVVDVSVVCEVEGGVLEKVVVELVPRVFMRVMATLQRAGESWEPIPAPRICL